MAYGSISTEGIPTLNNYAEAVRHFERVKPWRGKDERPIGNRTHRAKIIHRLLDGSIACRLYSTDVVTYHPDNTISVEFYDSRSTCEFASRILPWELRPFMHEGRMWLAVHAEEGKRHYYRQGTEPLTFRRMTAHGAPLLTFECLNADTRYRPTHRVLDRQASKDVRRRIKPMIDYLAAALAVHGNKPLGDLLPESKSPRSIRSEEARQIIAATLRGHDDPQDWLAAAWAFARRRFVWPTGASGVSPTMMMLEDWRGRVIDTAYSVAEAFAANEVPVTQLPRRGKWDRPR